MELAKVIGGRSEVVASARELRAAVVGGVRAWRRPVPVLRSWGPGRCFLATATIVGAVGDFATTWYGLRYTGASESNPAAVKLMGFLGIETMLAVAAVTCLTIPLIILAGVPGDRRARRLVSWALLAAVAVSAGAKCVIVAHNFRVLGLA
jgi:hypothetical protein